MKNVDFISLDQSGAVEEMPNGFISITANLTRTGIFTYRHVRPDGTIKLLKQLRLEEEVFSEEAMASLSGLPITNNHPTELVNPENASEYIVGMTSDNPKRIKVSELDSEDYVQQKLTIFDGDAILMVKNREKTEMSLGYQCNLDFTPGIYKGENYDCIQRNIRYNHGSIVDKARGGSECRILLDGTNEVVYDGESADEFIFNNGREPNVKKFTFEGTDYQVNDDVHGLLTSLVEKLGTANGLVKSKETELEKKEAICDDLTSQIKTLKDSSEDKEAFNAAVKARVELEGRGRKILGDEIALDGLTDREIKEKVITKLREGVNLDGKSEDYVNARFEIALEDASTETNTDSDDSDNGEDNLGKTINNQDANDGLPDAEKARKAAWDRDANSWKGDK